MIRPEASGTTWTGRVRESTLKETRQGLTPGHTGRRKLRWGHSRDIAERITAWYLIAKVRSHL